MPEQQALQRVQRLIRFGEVGEQRGVVGRGGLALPGRAELLEDFAEAAAAIDQRQDLRAVLAGVHHDGHARMLVPEHEGLAAAVAEHLRGESRRSGLVVKKGT
jgi:6-phosphogluconolactonase/glucosamine-6-phosphate isomerase/deaminase